MQTIITTEGKLGYLIEVSSLKKGKFVIPVVDVRDGKEDRELAERMLKDSNRVVGSKYFRPSYSWYGFSYNQSMKKH